MQTAVQYIDTAMVGALGTDATAAVGAITTINWLINGTVAALGIGFLSFIARACGANDKMAANEEVVQVAHSYGRKVMADLICVKNITERSQELIELGVDYVAVHTGVDVQKKEGRTPLKDLQELVKAIDPARAVESGGVNMQTIRSYIPEHPGIAVSGTALYNAPDIRAAVLEMKAAICQE